MNMKGDVQEGIAEKVQETTLHTGTHSNVPMLYYGKYMYMYLLFKSLVDFLACGDEEGWIQGSNCYQVIQCGVGVSDLFLYQYSAYVCAHHASDK